jgi:hypothetical protein
MDNNKINELKERIYAISDEIQDLRNESYELEHQLMALQQEKLKVLVGICIVDSGGVSRVVDVPQEKMFTTHFDFNPYQIPVVRLGKDTISKTTVFSRAVDADDPKEQFLKEHQTCTQNHFNKKLQSITDTLGGNV